MGCQLESQGATLQRIQKGYTAKGVLLCGIDRIEHPYDVEDYLRHFGFTFPVFVDLNQENAAESQAPLGFIGILDQKRQRVRSGLAGKAEFEPADAEKVVFKLLPASSATAAAFTPPAIRRARRS